MRLVDRVIETAIGCATGIVVLLVGLLVESRWREVAPADEC